MTSWSEVAKVSQNVVQHTAALRVFQQELVTLDWPTIHPSTQPVRLIHLHTSANKHSLVMSSLVDMWGYNIYILCIICLHTELADYVCIILLCIGIVHQPAWGWRKQWWSYLKLALPAASKKLVSHQLGKGCPSITRRSQDRRHQRSSFIPWSVQLLPHKNEQKWALPQLKHHQNFRWPLFSYLLLAIMTMPSVLSFFEGLAIWYGVLWYRWPIDIDHKHDDTYQNKSGTTMNNCDCP